MNDRFIEFWQQRAVSACKTEEALQLADAFSDECRLGKPVPAWALALRSLAASLRIRKSGQSELDRVYVVNKSEGGPPSEMTIQEFGDAFRGGTKAREIAVFADKQAAVECGQRVQHIRKLVRELETLDECQLDKVAEYLQEL